MNYLIKVIIILLFTFSNYLYANSDNIKLFSIDDDVYTSIDLSNRIQYLEVLNNIDLSLTEESEIIKDYIDTVMFYKYANSDKKIFDLVKKTSETTIKELTNNNHSVFKIINKDLIIQNLNFDFSRKIVLENLLSNYREYIFSNPNDTNLIYNYSLNYITIPIEKIPNIKELEKIIKFKDFKEIDNYLKINDIEVYIKNIAISDINKVNYQIDDLITKKNNIIYEKNINFYRLININKTLDLKAGIFYKLLSINLENKLENSQLNCQYLNSINQKTFKEYEYEKLNNLIKDNLLNINDYIILENENFLNYIFLCEIRIDENYLKELNINKKVSLLVKNIEEDFLEKYSKIYKIKKFYE